MALYNGGFPATYQPVYQPMQYQPVQYQPQMQQAQQMQQVQQPAPQPISATQAGIVRVQNENEARMYPVNPGSSVTFVNENAPYCYTKTVNMGQLDRPIFEKYRLIKEDDLQAPAEPTQKVVEMSLPDFSKYAMKDDVAAFKADLDLFRSEIETFKNDLYGLAGKKKTPAKKDNVMDE